MNLGAIGNLAHRLKLVRELPPKLVLAKIAKRLPWSNRRAVRVAEILHSPKDLNPERLFGFFVTQETFLREQVGWQPIDFAGRHVIEIGPGPLAGWGPMAIFRGAARVYGVDPDWVDGAFDDPGVVEAYLRPHHAALVEAFGSLMDFQTFRDRLSERLVVEAAGLDRAAPGFKADVVISNSCLEHIDDLDGALQALAALCEPHARFMHLVNFGNHRNRESPFELIYEMPPAAYRLKYGAHINLLRAPDILTAFAGAAIDAEMAVVDRPVEKLDCLSLHEEWQSRYNRDELAVRTALYISAQEGLES